MTIDAPTVQNTCVRLLIELVTLEQAIADVEGFRDAPSVIRRARGALDHLRIMGKQRELSDCLRQGDCVNIKHKGTGTFRGFIPHSPGKISIDREGYGGGWYDVDDIEPIEVDELRRWVEIGESSLIRADEHRTPVQPKRRADIAAWRDQLTRMTA